MKVIYIKKVKSITYVLLLSLILISIACQEDEPIASEERQEQDEDDQTDDPPEVDQQNDNPDNGDPINTIESVLNLPTAPYDYHVDLPDYFLNNKFPESFGFQNAVIVNDNTPIDNPTTNQGATLGRVLFYDTKLSANGTTSCAS